jgi:hypothetical protein
MIPLSAILLNLECHSDKLFHAHTNSSRQTSHLPGGIGCVYAGFNLGCVFSPKNQSRKPDKNIDTATNQNAASTVPLKCAVTPNPSAPMP